MERPPHFVHRNCEQFFSAGCGDRPGRIRHSSERRLSVESNAACEVNDVSILHINFGINRRRLCIHRWAGGIGGEENNKNEAQKSANGENDHDGTEK